MWDAEAIPQSSRPFDYLKMLSKSPRSLVIHGNYLADDELAFLGAQRNHMSLVYCPRTHAYFFHPPYPLGKALAAGVRVALGTDSRASSPDLNLLAEMCTVFRAQPWIDPQVVLRMATLDGAIALGRGDQVGSITSGKLANLVAMTIPAGAGEKPEEKLAAILSEDQSLTAFFAGRQHPAPPSAVYLAGRRL
jgi:cytosine/adenosine deaminase-related metal-dependent hydrolase